MRYRKSSTIIICLAIILLLTTTIMDFPAQTLSPLGNALVIHDALRPVDVIHVIAGDDYRTVYAIRLYQQGYAQKIFFTGGWCTEHGYFHGVHARDLAIQAGISPDAIAYDDSSVLSTYDEVVLLRNYLTQVQPGFRSVMVVSDPFHMRRARWTYHYLLDGKITLVMAPVPFDQTPFKSQWWTDAASKSYVIEEYQKMVYDFFRYQLRMSWLSTFDKY